MSDKTFKELAREIADAFVCKERNGEAIYCLTEEHELPDWIKECPYSVHNALDGRLPDDWVYRMIRLVAISLTDFDEPDDDTAAEIANTLTDTGGWALVAWLASNKKNAALVDEANEDLDVHGVVKLIQVGQYLAVTRIAEAVIEAVIEATGGAS